MAGFAHIEVRPNGDVVLVETFGGVSGGGGTGGGSGTVDESDISLYDVTTDDATTSRHGFLMKLSGNSNEYLDGTGNWTVPSTGSIGVSEANIFLSDVTTDDVTTSRHGFVPKAPNDTNKYLRGDGTWAVVSVSSVSTLGSDSLWSNKGDLIAGVTDNVAQILPVGATNGYGLIVDSSQVTGLKWSEILQNDPLWGAKGDLIVGATDNFAKILGVGATNTVLTVDSAQELGVKWETPRPIRSLNVVFGGAGSVVATGVAGDLTIDFDCVISQWTILADLTGSIQIDIWKDAYANYPPTVADTITASAKPLISSGIKGQSSTLTGWTTTINAGDTLRFNIDSASTITRATLCLKLI